MTRFGMGWPRTVRIFFNHRCKAFILLQSFILLKLDEEILKEKVMIFQIGVDFGSRKGKNKNASARRYLDSLENPMVEMRLVECSFLIPVRRDDEFSDGELHSTDAWDWLTGELFNRFDGWTVAPGYYEGVWKSPTGNPVPDKSRKYVIAVAEAKLDHLRELIVEACAVFHQRVIYLSIAGQVEFIEGFPDASTP